MAKEADDLDRSTLADRQAGNLRDVASAALMYGSMADALGHQMLPEAFQRYHDQLLEDFGSPRDPAEEMLIEQLALAHLNIGRLMLRSATAKQHEAGVAFAAAATRLMGEFRRSALALQDYRERTAGPRGVVGADRQDDSQRNGSHEKSLRRAK